LKTEIVERNSIINLNKNPLNWIYSD
jgi:hypothetical protein